MKIRRPPSIGEETLALHLKAEKIHFEREKQFHLDRKWRFDFALPGMVAVEVEGGTYGVGRHTSIKGFANDCDKYNEAALMGWKVLRFTTAMVKKGQAIEVIKRAITMQCPTRYCYHPDTRTAKPSRRGKGADV